MDEGSKLVGTVRGTNEVIYEYTFHDNGTITDGLNLTINSSTNLITKGGSTIEAVNYDIGKGINDFTKYHGLLNSFQSGYLTCNYDNLIRNPDGTFNINKFSKYISIKNTTQFVGGSLNALSYFESANDFYNQNYLKGTTGAVHNTIGIYSIGALGWYIGTSFGENLINTELYNRIIFGENSSTYRNRQYNWYKSKILKE